MLVKAVCLDVNDHEGFGTNMVLLRLPKDLVPLEIKQYRNKCYFWYKSENPSDRELYEFNIDIGFMSDNETLVGIVDAAFLGVQYAPEGYVAVTMNKAGYEVR